MENNLMYEMHWDKPGGRRPMLGSLDMCSNSALNVFFSSLTLAASKGKKDTALTNAVCSEISLIIQIIYFTRNHQVY